MIPLCERRGNFYTSDVEVVAGPHCWLSLHTANRVLNLSSLNTRNPRKKHKDTRTFSELYHLYYLYFVISYLLLFLCCHLTNKVAYILQRLDRGGVLWKACLSVCLSARLYQESHIQTSNFLYITMVVARSLTGSVLPVLWMQSCLHTMARDRRRLKVYSHWTTVPRAPAPRVSARHRNAAP